MRAKKTLWVSILSLAIVGGAFIAYQAYVTNLAHTTFDRYYAFRGCVSPVDKADTYAHCKLPNGEVIKIVLINDKWYLDGDGPGIW